MHTLIVVPARYGSKRFPGKPLHKIAGRTLVERVYRIAEAASRDAGAAALVATDDARIAAHCREIGAPHVLTDPALPSGTDRALAAARMQDTAPDFVVNLQGDAPFTPPAQIRAVIDTARDTGAPVVTPVVRLSWPALDTVRAQKTAQPFSGTSCVRAGDGRALWFSKTVLPAMRQEAALRAAGPQSPVFRHIGLYGYTMEALAAFAAAPPGQYETLEGLEQLRFLENGIPVHTVEVAATDRSMWGVDTPEDAGFAERLIADHGDPLDGL
ncbi:MAG: manno-octulosonate cytidylyltransferase [Pseudomonadota bacterium]